MTEQEFHRALTRHLTDWYTANCRDLPWRKTRDPYSVLVSESMLQQTQVERVKTYYSRWMERLPTFTALAAADEGTVMELWQGLGYYSRAKNLRRAAIALTEAGYTELPPDPVLIRSLPGIGPYTAGAVCSIAFDIPEPAVDGNVRRVFSRLLDMTDDPTKRRGNAIVTRHVRAILELGAPHILTQAFMELGAVICLPACRCESCPVGTPCAAKAAGTQMQRPVAARKKALKRREAAAVLLTLPDGSVLLRKRSENGLWAGFYELPWVIADENEDAETAFARLASELSLPSCAPVSLTEILRFTTWQVRLCLWHADAAAPLPGTFAVFPEKIAALSMPAGMKRLLLKALGEREEPHIHF